LRFELRAAAVRFLICVAVSALALSTTVIPATDVPSALLWVVILLLPGGDLRVRYWEILKVDGLLPVFVALRAVATRWVPAAVTLAGLFCCDVFGGGAFVSTLASSLILTSLGVAIGRYFPRPAHLIPTMWILWIVIPILSEGRFLSDQLRAPREFLVVSASATLLTFAFLTLDTIHIARGRVATPTT
jgi:hypothetical protein